MANYEQPTNPEQTASPEKSSWDVALDNVKAAEAIFEAEWNDAYKQGNAYPDSVMVIEDLDEARKLFYDFEDKVRLLAQQIPVGDKEKIAMVRGYENSIKSYEDDYRTESQGDGEDHGYEGLGSEHDDEDGNYQDPHA